MITSPHRVQRSRRGSAALEFFLWMPILVLLLSAVVDWGYYMSVRSTVSRAAMDGARVSAATFEPATSTPGSLVVPRAEARAQQVLNDSGVTCGGAPVCVVDAQYCPDSLPGPCDLPADSACSGPACYAPVDALRVTISYQFEPFFGLGGTPETIFSEFVMAMENQR